MQSISSKGPSFFNYILFWFGNVYESFKITIIHCPFFSFDMYLRTDGRTVIKNVLYFFSFEDKLNTNPICYT